MTGLEKIVGHIEANASECAEAILREANKKAEDILHKAEKESAAKKSAELEKLKIEEESFLQRAESAAALQKRKMILETKQNLIVQVIEKSRQELLDLPVNDYFAKLITMIPKYAQKQSGSICFSKKDQMRLPSGYEQDIAKALESNSGASLKISDQTVKIDGGFILIYDDIEINCSFEALLAEQKDQIADQVSALLFEV